MLCKPPMASGWRWRSSMPHCPVCLPGGLPQFSLYSSDCRISNFTWEKQGDLSFSAYFLHSENVLQGDRYDRTGKQVCPVCFTDCQQQGAVRNGSLFNAPVSTIDSREARYCGEEQHGLREPLAPNVAMPYNTLILRWLWRFFL